MKRLWLIVLVLALLVSCGGKKDKPDETPLPTQEAEIVKVPENKVETKEPIKPPEPKKPTYQDHKENVIETLDQLTELKTTTEIVVNATGGSFLMPRFDIFVNKTLEHTDKPLNTHVIISTQGPIFLNLGPSKVEVYTKPDGTVYALDQTKNKYVRQREMKPEQVRSMYDGETRLQKRIWQNQKMKLEEGSRLIATLELEGKAARDLMTELFKMYGMAVEFDSQEMSEQLELEMVYDSKTYHPISLKGTGTTEAFGYDLAFDIQVDYDDVESD